MARLIPKIAPQDISNIGERDVAMALVDQLPDDVIIYHSYPWLKSDRNDFTKKVTLREGEADFVIVHPKAGILILEVKGGEIHYDHENRGWYRQEASRRVQIKDPFEQARGSTHILEQGIRKESFPNEKTIPCPYGYAVIFPHCEFSGPAPPGADTSMIFSGPDLEFLGQRITKLLGLWKRGTNSVNLTKHQMTGIQLALSPAFQLLPVLFRQVKEQEDRLLRLTDDQVRLLQFLGAHKRAAIKGVAGSGKTILAIAQAQRFAREGLKTLFVCYNKSLAEWLEASLPDELRNLIQIDTFHGLCAEWCRKARIPFAPKWNDGGNFWRTTAPDLLLNALEIVPDKFDAVVVDEGQDFEADWWIALEMLNSGGEEGPFYIFFDPAQNLFVGQTLSIPDVGAPFDLPTNCRNTKQIALTCGKIRNVEIPVRPDAPDGVVTEVAVIPQPDARAQKIRQIVEAWIGKGKLKASQIAVLSPFDKNKSCLADDTKIGKIPLCINPNEWRAEKGVLFATIRSFKGLEADAIIVTDVPNPETTKYFSVSDFYVGCSRAKHLLVVLTTEKGIIT
ncbi:NERD domain-containing protein [Gimesia sp.]|uniref:nuclease-related domain-containing DEAD/DEAH box helicase n=1 Tax=Gimesia sp. TaxID=2024833 RepID=UPI0032EEC57B